MDNLGSSDFHKLTSFLKEHGMDFVSNVKASHSTPTDFVLFVPGDRVAAKTGKGMTSHRQMKLLQQAAKHELGLDVEWIVTPGQQAAALEAALQQLIEAHHPGAVGAVYISSPKVVPVSVWVETKANAQNPPQLAVLKALVEKFLKLYDIADPLVMYGDSENLPSNPTILRKLKIHAPLTTEQLAGFLVSSRSVIPNARWLQTRLDALRKRGLVVRSPEGQYSLTEFGLEIVPYGKTRSSSDIERALALGRRKW
jgi:hypothetical protein